MDHRKVYNILIDRAKYRELIGYKEVHHILPRCMGGGNEAENLVALTAREHFIAHVLLVKIYPEKPSLIYAVKMMCRNYTSERSRNRMYEWLRIREAQVSSKMNSGEGNAFFGKTHSEETRRKISEARKSQPRKVVEKTIWTPEMLSERGRKAAESRKANGNSARSEETKDKIRQTKAAQPIEKKQGGKKNKGRKFSQEYKDLLSNSRKGKPAHNKGKLLSDEAKANVAAGQRVEPYVGSELCGFGCGQIAQFIKPAGKGSLMCESHHSRCPEVKTRKAEKLVNK